MNEDDIADIRAERRKRKERDAEYARLQEQPEWFEKLLKTKKGTPLSNVTNALIALREAPKIRDLLAYDEMLRHPMVLPGPEPLASENITDIQVELQLTGLRTVGFEITKQAIVRRAKENAYHPLRDELTSLSWDGIPRLSRAAVTYLGAEDTPYNCGIVAMFSRQMVRRVFEPGCQADYMLILEGEQGEEKSKFCRVLAGDKYFSDSCPELKHGKEVSQHLRGKWLIEFPEMHLYSKADIDHHKAFLTRTHERYRPPYEPAEVEEPRQCVFIGTSNKTVYLRDETGNRRYWGLTCGKIQIEYLIRDRTQLLAEAVHDYRNGEPCWPNREFEREHIQPEQEARYEEDVWTTTIAQYVGPLSRITAIAIATGCLDIPIGKVDGTIQIRIARVLRKIGWICRRNNRERWWEPIVPPNGDTSNTKPSPSPSLITY